MPIIRLPERVSRDNLGLSLADHQCTECGNLFNLAGVFRDQICTHEDMRRTDPGTILDNGAHRGYIPHNSSWWPYAINSADFSFSKSCRCNGCR